MPLEVMMKDNQEFDLEIGRFVDDSEPPVERPIEGKPFHEVEGEGVTVVAREDGMFFTIKGVKMSEDEPNRVSRVRIKADADPVAGSDVIIENWVDVTTQTTTRATLATHMEMRVVGEVRDQVVA